MNAPDKDLAPWGMHWRRFFGELWVRTLRPFSYPSFVGFFFVAVVLLGGGGVWLEAWNYHFHDIAVRPETSSLRIALITFFLALAGSSSMQLVMEEESYKSLKTFGIFVLVVAFAFALVVSSRHLSSCIALILAWAGAVVSLWVWWIANANQKDFQDPDIPAGGRLDKALAGDLGDYRVN